MKFDKNLYEGLVLRPLMMGKKIGRKFARARVKWESWRELLVGENYSLTSTVESHYLELTLTVFVDNMKQITGPHVVFFILPYHNELEYFFIDSYKTMFIFFFIFATSLTLVITGSS